MKEKPTNWKKAYADGYRQAEADIADMLNRYINTDSCDTTLLIDALARNEHLPE
jgi:hypothetical protein